jgi:transcriptional regulator with XRE-family HTH domain
MEEQKMSIKEERQRRRWSQVDLAYHSRVSTSEISKIENGRLKPSVGQIERIARALGVRPDELQESNHG